MLIRFLIFSVSLALDAGFENEVNEEMAEMGVNSKVSIDALLPLPRHQWRNAD
jgi:hypothetical protein